MQTGDRDVSSLSPPLQDQTRVKTTSKHLCHGQRPGVAAWPGHGTVRRAGTGRGGCCPSPAKHRHPSPSPALLHTQEFSLKVCQSALACAGGGCTENRLAGGWAQPPRQEQTLSERHMGSLGMGREQGRQLALPVCWDTAQVPPRPALVTPGPPRG